MPDHEATDRRPPRGPSLERVVETLLTSARNHPDPADRLRALASLEAVLVDAVGHARAHKGAAARDLHDGPARLSWEEVGALLGVTGERARQIAAA